MFVVAVTFDLAPGKADAFLDLVRTNATRSLADEPGCHRFDVCHDADRPESVFLYEIYDDAAAFEAHRDMPHYAEFDAAIAHIVVGKTVNTYREVWT